MTSSFKHRLPKSLNNRQRDRTTTQIELFDTSPAKAQRGSGRIPQQSILALYATPSQCKQPGGLNWWNIRCSYNRRMFGGLYSTAERDKILLAFDGRTAQVSPREFGAVAERVIAETNKLQGAES